MYHQNQTVDKRPYPPRCPECEGSGYLDMDWETGLGYCLYCGYDFEHYFEEERA